MQGRPNADLCDHPADAWAAYKAAWERGDARAVARCTALGQKPDDANAAWWTRPWEEEEEDLKRMRVATADELGDEVVAAGLNADVHFLFLLPAGGVPCVSAPSPLARFLTPRD